MTVLKTELAADQSELKNVGVPHEPLAYFRHWLITTTYHLVYSNFDGRWYTVYPNPVRILPVSRRRQTGNQI